MSINEIARENLFATPIWHFDIDSNIDFNLIKEQCNQIKDDDLGRTESNENGYQSNNIELTNYKEIEKLMSFIMAQSYVILNDIKVSEKLPLTLQECWLNINGKHSKNRRHSHGNALLSGVVYIDVPENSGNIRFYRQLNNSYYYRSYYSGDSEFVHEYISYKPVNKKAIIFQSYLEHDVEENLTDKQRYSIAFNIGIPFFKKT
jgi:uncharacterized protein (TIGR02466 family)